VTATTVVDQAVTTTTVPDTCVTIPREKTVTPSTEPAVDGTVVAYDVCVAPTTVAAIVVPSDASTTTSPASSTTASERLPATGSDAGTSRYVVLMLLALGTSLVIISRRRLASTDSDRTPR
jgi:LPXTG-motif cell wall-anchored protein